jgi:O-acetylhomoserine (thiol)-lyase
MTWHKDTLSLHGGQDPDPASGSRALPIYQTTSYVFQSPRDAAELFSLAPRVWAPRLTPPKGAPGSEAPPKAPAGNIYTRIMNPTTDVLEKRMSLLEGGIGGLATSSGSAAIFYAVLNLCRSGDHLVSSSSLYGGTYNLLLHTLPQFGIRTSFVPADRPESFAEAVEPRTKAFFVESVGNPRLDVPDLEALAERAHAAGMPLIVDNTVPSPYLCQPLAHGADIAVHSLTKYCGGHGNSLGGIIVDGGAFPWAGSGRFPMLSEPDPSYHDLVWSEAVGSAAYILRARSVLLRDTGACIAPMNSWLILQGLETLHLRMERHAANGMAVARFLEDHPRVEWVLYPGLASHPSHEQAKKYLPRGCGGLVGFGIKGGASAGSAFIEALELFSHVANIGDAKSLAIHPASTTHAQLSPEDQEKSGVTPDFIRLSVGIEHPEDILADLDQALERSS